MSSWSEAETVTSRSATDGDSDDSWRDVVLDYQDMLQVRPHDEDESARPDPQGPSDKNVSEPKDHALRGAFLLGTELQDFYQEPELCGAARSSVALGERLYRDGPSGPSGADCSSGALGKPLCTDGGSGSSGADCSSGTLAEPLCREPPQGFVAVGDFVDDRCYPKGRKRPRCPTAETGRPWERYP